MGIPLAVMLALVSGCSEELGPERFATARVCGRIHVQDQPVGGGWVEFMPVEGTRGDLRSAPLRPDGTFQADRVAVGRNAVRLVQPAIPLPVPGMFDTYQTPVRRTIPEAPETCLDIDLWLETLLYLREHASS